MKFKVAVYILYVSSTPSRRVSANNLDMNSNKITNVGAPANAQDVTSKRYVDSLAGTPPLKDQIRAYYSFDGDYKDSTTNNYDGTAVGSGSIGFSNTALINQSFESTTVNGDYLDLGAGAMDFGTDDFSVSCWVNLKSTSGAWIWATAIDSNNRIVLYLNSGTDFKLGVENNGNFSRTNSGVPISTGQWYHLVLVREGSNYRLYQNHTKVIDTTDSNANLTGNISHVGANENGDGGIDAYIDEMGIWDRVLSQQEILHLYNNHNGNAYLSSYDWYAITQHNHVDMNGYRVSNLGEALQSSDAVDKAYVDSRAPMAQLEQGARAYYKFDGDYTDSIGSFDGTNNGPSLTSGKIGQAVDTTSGYVNVGSLFGIGSNDFAISGWIYIKNHTSNGIAGDYDGTSYIYIADQNNGKVKIQLDDGGTDSVTETNTVFNTNQWYFLTFVRDTSASEVKIYVDGQLDKTGSSSVGNINSGVDTALGSINTSSSTFDGLIDEFAMWRVAY